MYNVEYFCATTHAHTTSFFKKKQVFLKLTAFFILITRDIYTKMLTFSENSQKINVR